MFGHQPRSGTSGPTPLRAEGLDHSHTRRRRAALLYMRAPLSSVTTLGFSLFLSRFASMAPSPARRVGSRGLLGKTNKVMVNANATPSLGLVDVGEAAATAGLWEGGEEELAPGWSWETNIARREGTAHLAVLVGGHEDTGAAGLGGALATETLDLAVRVDAVVLEDCHLDRLALVLDLLRGGVRLLLALLGHTTAQAEDEVEGRLLLDVVVRKSAAVLELLAGKDETLLVGGDALLVLDLGLDVVDRVGRLDLEGDRLAREGCERAHRVSWWRCDRQREREGTDS